MSIKKQIENTQQCLVCSSANLVDLFCEENIPIYNLHYFDNRIQALSAEKTNVFFVQCQDCGFLFNKEYKQLSYKIEYDANRSHSNTFNNYLIYISKRLTKYFNNQINKVVEIGACDCNFA